MGGAARGTKLMKSAAMRTQDRPEDFRYTAAASLELTFSEGRARAMRRNCQRDWASGRWATNFGGPGAIDRSDRDAPG